MKNRKANKEQERARKSIMNGKTDEERESRRRSEKLMKSKKADGGVRYNAM